VAGFPGVPPANVWPGILGRERFQYEGLLIWTCFRCPSHFSLAVAFSIQGDHFRRTGAALEL
jgi:hypothetical protein